MTEINIQYPDWYFILCPLIGLIYAVALYFKNQILGEQKAWLPYLLAALRGTAIALIVFLLLDPFIRSVFQDQKNPIVVILDDQSKSIDLASNTDSIAQYELRLDKLNATLSKLYDVKYHSFGARVADTAADSLDAQTSNLDLALQYVKDNYSDQNLGAVILSSDGIYNEGKNPIYGNYNIKSPIYTIALGDTTLRKDLWVKNVFHNQIAYLGDKLSIQVDVQSNNCIGQSSQLTLSKINKGKSTTLKKEKININANDYFKTYSLEVSINQPGINHYRVSLNKVKGEVILDNNYKDFYIEVLDARQQILVVAHAPNPDISTLRTLLSQNKNYELDLKYANNINVNVNDYDFVIMHDLPSAKYPIQPIINEIKSKKIPSLYIIGQQTDISLFNNSQSTINIKASNKLSNKVQATVSSGFSLFKLSDAIKQNISSFPPVTSVFAEFDLGPKTYVALNQKIGDINTDYPLLAFSENSGQRTGVLTAEGIWRWKLYNYVQNQNYDIVKELLMQSVQYLSVKEDKRKFRARTNKKLYNENEPVYFEAQLFNANYESINDAEVSLDIENENKETFSYTMSRTNDYYTLPVSGLSAGSYKFVANTNSNGTSMNDKGDFTIQSIDLESYDLTARHGLLNQLSTQSNGSLFYASQISQLENILTTENKLKPVLYESTKTNSLLNLWWILGFAILLLATEWFIRRFIGSY